MDASEQQLDSQAQPLNNSVPNPSEPQNDYSGQFTIELSVCHANAINRILPARYSLQIDRTVRTKKSHTRKRNTADNKSRISRDPEDNFTENEIPPPQPVIQPVHLMGMHDVIKRGQKIVAQLRKNKNSWPFLEPVNPVAMGIPHYAEIVKDPMDLQTVSNNLAQGRYATITQFYADVQLIIKNSLLFNKANPDFLKVTQDFEKCYLKCKAEPITISKMAPKPLPRMSSSPPIPKTLQKSKTETKNFLTIVQKKELAAKIKNLMKSDLIQLARTICDDDDIENYEINLENMSAAKLNIIKEFIEKKQRASGVKRQERKSSEPSQESSFKSDSDS